MRARESVSAHRSPSTCRIQCGGAHNDRMRETEHRDESGNQEREQPVVNETAIDAVRADGVIDAQNLDEARNQLLLGAGSGAATK